MAENLFPVLLAFAPLPFFFLIYLRYFLSRPRWLHHIEAILLGVVMAIAVALFKTFYSSLFLYTSPAFSGFVLAALPEKFVAILMIFYIQKRKGGLTGVLDGIKSGIFFGLGFSAFENVLYAMGTGSGVILVRFLSAVPLHVYTCGMIGYFLASALLAAPSFQKIRYYIYALIIPFILHGLFDTFLFSRGDYTYYIGPLIVLLSVLVELFFAKSASMPEKEALDAEQQNLSDWKAMEKEPQYDRWIMHSSGMANTKEVPFFLFNFPKNKRYVLAAVGALVILYIPFREEFSELFLQNISRREAWTLFVVLPFSYAFSLFAAGSVNPDYFRFNIIKIPVSVGVDYIAESTGSNMTITNDITDANVFIQSVEPLVPGEEVMLVFHYNDITSPEIYGEVIWDNHEEDDMNTGSLVRIHRTLPGFYRFLAGYNMFKITRGLSYNLKMPGFEGLRRLFVNPLTIMQKQEKYPAGTVIFNEGDSGEHFYLVKKGEVAIYKHIAGKGRQLMTTLYEGDIFGEMVLAGTPQRSASAICQTDCIIAVADKDNLTALIKNNPEFTEKLIKELVQRLFSSEQIMQENIRAINHKRIMQDTLGDLIISAAFLTPADRSGDDIVFDREVFDKNIKSLTGENSLAELLSEYISYRHSLRELAEKANPENENALAGRSNEWRYRAK